MLDHSHIVSRNLDAARRFYRATAKPLGLDIIEAGDGFDVGKADRGTMLRVKAVDMAPQDEAPETHPTHVALEAPDDFTVRAFFRAAMEAGGRQVGYPSPQPVQGYRYYSAKVADPDGNCIECGWRH